MHVQNEGGIKRLREQDDLLPVPAKKARTDGIHLLASMSEEAFTQCDTVISTIHTFFEAVSARKTMPEGKELKDIKHDLNIIKSRIKSNRDKKYPETDQILQEIKSILEKIKKKKTGINQQILDLVNNDEGVIQQLVKDGHIQIFLGAGAEHLKFSNQLALLVDDVFLEKYLEFIKKSREKRIGFYKTIPVYIDLSKLPNITKEVVTHMSKSIGMDRIHPQTFACMLDVPGKFCDHTLIVDDKRIQVNKALLTASSSFFKTLILGPMRRGEKNENETHLTEADPDCVEACINFLHGKFTLESDETHFIGDLIYHAQLFGLDQLAITCFDRIIRMVTSWEASNTIYFSRFEEIMKNLDKLFTEEQKELFAQIFSMKILQNLQADFILSDLDAIQRLQERCPIMMKNFSESALRSLYDQIASNICTHINDKTLSIDTIYNILNSANENKLIKHLLEICRIGSNSKQNITSPIIYYIYGCILRELKDQQELSHELEILKTALETSLLEYTNFPLSRRLFADITLCISNMDSKTQKETTEWLQLRFQNAEDDSTYDDDLFIIRYFINYLHAKATNNTENESLKANEITDFLNTILINDPPPDENVKDIFDFETEEAIYKYFEDNLDNNAGAATVVIKIIRDLKDQLDKEADMDIDVEQPE
jgi:hypothetical protein